MPFWKKTLENEDPDEPDSNLSRGENNFDPIDNLIKSVTEFRSRFKEALNQIILKDKPQAQMPEIEKVYKARQLLRKTGVGEAVAGNLLRTVWHWESWSKRHDFEKYNYFSAKNVSGRTYIDENDSTVMQVSFTYQNSQFVLKFRNKYMSFDGGGSDARIDLYFDGEKVLEISVFQHFGDEYDNWKYSDVEALSVGNWIQKIVEIDELIEMNKYRLHREFQDEKLKKRAKHIKGI